MHTRLLSTLREHYVPHRYSVDHSLVKRGRDMMVEQIGRNYMVNESSIEGVLSLQVQKPMARIIGDNLLQ